MAFNLARDSAKRIKRRAAVVLRPKTVPDPSLSPELLDLATALRALPLRQRQVIVLHHLVGLPVLEIASELGLRTGTVKSRLLRGRAALARQLAPESAEGMLR